MKASIAVAKGNDSVILTIAPLTGVAGMHQVKVVRAEPGSTGKITIRTFFLNSEGHCFEFLRQMQPIIGYSDAVTTVTVMAEIAKNNLEELYNGD